MDEEGMIVCAQLRNFILDAVGQYGIVEVEGRLGIVVLGIRRSGIENVKVED